MSNSKIPPRTNTAIGPQICRLSPNAAPWSASIRAIAVVAFTWFATSLLPPVQAQSQVQPSASYRYSLEGQESEHPANVVFSADGRWVCTGNHNPHIKSYRGVSASVVNKPSHIAEGSFASARLWDLTTGQEVRRLLGHHAWQISSLAFSPNGKYLATTGYRYSYAERRSLSGLVRITPGYQIRLWDISTGEELHLWDELGGTLGFSSDGKYLVATSSTYGVVVLDTSTGEKVASWNIRCSDELAPLAMPNPKQMLLMTSVGAFSSQHTPAIIDLTTGKFVRRFVGRDASKTIEGLKYNSYSIQSVAFSRDHALMGIGCEQGVFIWDVNSAAEIRRLELTSATQVLCFSDDSRSLSAITDEGQSVRWNLTTGERTYEASWSPGTYRYSPNGQLLAHVPTKSNTAYWELRGASKGESFARFYQPLKDRQWACETHDGHLALASDAGTAGTAVPDPANALLAALDADQNPQADDSQLATAPDLVAETLGAVLRAHGGISKPKPQASSLAESTPADAATQPTPSGKGKLFVLTVGVSKHKFSEYDLGFARKDAEDFAAFFRKQNSLVFEDVFVKVYTDKEATSDNLVAGLRWLEQSCTSADIAIVLFAGHGLTARKGLYFLTWEGDAGSIQNTCLNWERVAQSLTKTPAKQIVFFADCCHAGAFSKQRFLTQQSIAELLSKQENVTVFCSSSGNEQALESKQWKNGAFTMSLLHGSSGKADSNADGSVSLEEIIRYARRTVPALTGGLQHPTLVNANRVIPNILLTSQRTSDGAATKQRTGRMLSDADVKDAKTTIARIPAGTTIRIERTHGRWALGEFTSGGKRIRGWVLLHLIDEQ